MLCIEYFVLEAVRRMIRLLQ